MSLLEVNNISKRFGGLQAIKDVGFRVEQGCIKAVIGPNGAGKTTLFNMVSGFLLPDSGSISFAGKPVHGRSPFEIASLGMSRTFQHIRLFSHMTALENIMVGRHVRSRAGFVAGMLNLPWTWQEEREVREKSLATMDFLGIVQLADADATSLSYGLNMRETADMAKLIARIRDRGITVLIVEHDMQLVMNISDEVVVLSYGEKIADDVPRAVQNDPEVVRVYLGEDDA